VPKVRSTILHFAFYTLHFLCPQHCWGFFVTHRRGSKQNLLSIILRRSIFGVRYSIFVWSFWATRRISTTSTFDIRCLLFDILLPPIYPARSTLNANTPLRPYCESAFHAKIRPSLRPLSFPRRRESSFVHLNFDVWICFGFRV